MDTIKTVLLTSQILIAVITDVNSYKVKNLMIFVFIIAGAFYNIFPFNHGNLFSSMLGLLVPAIILMPLYILKMLGAGDIKLFCSIGFLLGFKDILYDITYSYLFGLVLALLIMLIRGNLTARFNRLFIYIKSCILTMNILPYDDLNTQSDGRMHFTIPIALGTIAVILF